MKDFWQDSEVGERNFLSISVHFFFQNTVRGLRSTNQPPPIWFDKHPIFEPWTFFDAEWSTSEGWDCHEVKHQLLNPVATSFLFLVRKNLKKASQKISLQSPLIFASFINLFIRNHEVKKDWTMLFFDEPGVDDQQSCWPVAVGEFWTSKSHQHLFGSGR